MIDKKEFKALSDADRTAFLKNISKEYPQFQFVKETDFESFGQSNHTAIYLYEGEEFVFVPADEVTLGWEKFSAKLPDELNQKLEQDRENWQEKESIEELIHHESSPIRVAKIGAMLVERFPKQVGWREVSLDDEDLLENYSDELEEFRTSSKYKNVPQFIINDDVKFERNGKEIKAFLMNPTTYEELLEETKQNGFSIATEDEWEYLCGQGHRTLFRTGDYIDFKKYKVKHFDAEHPKKKPYTLEEPNALGLKIAYDPYEMEVVDAPILFKGGDGGVIICGGYGAFWGYLPTSPYFRPNLQMNKDWIEMEGGNIGGEYIVYRRIFRL